MQRFFERNLGPEEQDQNCALVADFERVRSGSTTNSDDIAFGDALCLKHLFPRVTGIAETKANDRYQLRIQEAGRSKMDVGQVYWGNRGAWLRCDDKDLTVVRR